MDRWYAVKVACVLGADGVAVLLGVCCGGVALLVALVVAFLVLSWFALCAGVGCGGSA